MCMMCNHVCVNVEPNSWRRVYEAGRLPGWRAAAAAAPAQAHSCLQGVPDTCELPAVVSYRRKSPQRPLEAMASSLSAQARPFVASASARASAQRSTIVRAAADGKLEVRWTSGGRRRQRQQLLSAAYNGR